MKHNNKSHYPHPLIAKEGWVFIFFSLIITIFVFDTTSFLVSIPFILITIFIIQFFRDPAREIPADPNAILSPADGKIICIEEAEDPYLKTKAIKVSIFMNVFNVHSNRSPVDGKILDIEYIKGKFVNADFDKASTDNERNIMLIESTNSVGVPYKITVIQIAGLIARRILCYKKVSDTISKGERYGFIRFGSRVDLYLPLNMQVLVTIGQKVLATRSIIAKY